MHHRAVRNVGFPIQLQYLRFVHPFEQVAKTIDDDLMRNDQHTLAAILARHRIDDAAQPQDHVAPAFTAWRPEIKLADMRTLRTQDRKSTCLNSSHGYISYAVFCLTK